MRVLITGSSGFFGSHLVARFSAHYQEVIPLPSVICDLRDLKQAQTALGAVKPDMVIHAAAMCGGIGFNEGRQGESLYHNTLMNLQTLEAARLAKVRRVVNIGSSCAYPDQTETCTEDSLWKGLPYVTNVGYGMAKRLQQLQGDLYNQQYGMDVLTVFLPNLYGENDRFGEGSHVIAALIRRFVEAKETNLPEVRVWGSGEAIREFLYASDAAEGVLRASLFKLAGYINIGSGMGQTIREVAETIKRAVGYKGRVIFDTTKPGGQTVKVMSVDQMKRLLNWEPTTPFEQGITATVNWYLTSKRYRLAATE